MAARWPHPKAVRCRLTTQKSAGARCGVRVGEGRARCGANSRSKSHERAMSIPPRGDALEADRGRGVRNACRSRVATYAGRKPRLRGQNVALRREARDARGTGGIPRRKSMRGRRSGRDYAPRECWDVLPRSTMVPRELFCPKGKGLVGLHLVRWFTEMRRGNWRVATVRGPGW